MEEITLKHLESVEQYTELRNSGKHIFLFSADWCKDCRFIEPFMPNIAHKIRSQIGIEQSIIFKDFSSLEPWGQLEAGLKLNTLEHLFPKTK